MSLHPEPIGEIPPDTVRVARSAFPKGSVVIRLRDGFGDLYVTRTSGASTPGGASRDLLRGGWRLSPYFGSSSI